MSLKITASEILIQNAAGVTKFSATDKMLYLKNYQAGSISMGLSDVQTWFNTPIAYPSDPVFMKIEFTALDGSNITWLRGYEMMAGGSIALNTVGGSYASMIDTEQTVLNIGIVRGAVIFRKYKVNGEGRLVYANTSFTLNYKWYQYSSL